MEEQNNIDVPKHSWLTIFAGGYLVYLFILFGIFAAFMIPVFRSIANKPSTPSITTVPTPQILVHVPADKNSIRFEDFLSNQRDWSLEYASGKIETINGKLILQTYSSGWPAIGQNQLFIPNGSIYYVQADFMTDIDANQPYGLVFGRNDTLDTFYLFEILPHSNQFSLYKYAPGKWDALVPFSNTEINPYPEVNTLSAYFNKGQIELYINGNLVTSCSDQQPYTSVGVGVLADNSSYRLIVDNFFAYSEK